MERLVLDVFALATPGIVREAWTVIDVPGVYRGLCTYYCGAGHPGMTVVVRAVGQDEFERWIERIAQPDRRARGADAGRGPSAADPEADAQRWR